MSSILDDLHKSIDRVNEKFHENKAQFMEQQHELSKKSHEADEIIRQQEVVNSKVS